MSKICCEKCGTPECLILKRFASPPVGFVDFIDRTNLLMSSGHYGWRPWAHFVGLVVVFVVLGLLTVLCIQGPVGYTEAGTGGAVLFGASVACRWWRDRRTVTARQVIAETTEDGPTASQAAA